MSVNAQLVTEVEIENIPKKFVVWKTLKWRAVLAELISTMFLISLGCMTCIPIEGSSNPLYAPLGFGLIVTINIQSFGHISGAHMNPSVTLAAVILGQTSITLGVVYMIAQCTGAVIGYGILVFLSPSGFLASGVCITAPLMKYSVYQAIGIEMLLTAALVFISCAVWDPANKDSQESNSLKFGFTIVGLSLAGGPMTGASMNPARSLAPALWTSAWRSHWIYWAGPMAGSVVSSLFYKYAWLKVEKSKPDILTWHDGGGLTQLI